ncbi:nitroreductase family protein [Pelagicoccus sp. SDUM812003]|uniref:nitroreductase family protein n=1 Tax=Pelagicoccus sp. SDUM812003 TaxID=3041267 RepID=UPI00280D03BD|nr:nitroreductase family protein [Pelagicoccus sp. SDUM812003]MDQ8203277.1 nitroreductase family protein [Pelagicoccus sp. SDUM812003]
MNTLEAIEQRRSVKHYDPNFQIPETDLTKILESAIKAPTSYNIQNWRFVVVRDPETKTRLRAAAWDQAQVEEASAAILICGDLKAHSRDPERYWENAPEQVQDMLVPMIGDFYEGKEEVQRDEVMRSAGLAGQTIMLAAKSLGYDTCPMIGFDPEAFAEIINLPEDHVIGMLVVVGKAKEPARPRGGQLPLEEVVFHDSF